MDKKIKVLHTEWSDGWGGQEIRIISEMLAVKAEGIEVYLACREHSKIRQKAIEHNIHVFTLPFRGNFDLKTLFSLINIIQENKISIVNTHSGKDTWVGGIAAKLAGAKFIRTRHLSNKINSSKLNFINKLADFIFTTGESIRETMIQNNHINPNKIMSIPTGIDENIFDPFKYNKVECKKLFNIKDDELTIGILAVLRDFKRHDYFINIAKNIINTYPDKKICFIIAGEGPRRRAIEQQIAILNLKNHVRLIGHIENVAQFLHAIDIFVLPSDKNEGVPQSLIQALMMGTPSVSTNVGSISDLYQDNNFLISEPIESKILDNVKELICNNKLKSNRDFIVNNFSQNTIKNKIIKIYDNLLKDYQY